LGWSYTFYRALAAMGPGLTDTLTTIHTPGIAMTALPGAQTLADLYQPYFNMKEWELYHEHLYCPPDKPTGRPALARSGNVFHFSFPVFRGYIQHAVIATNVRVSLRADGARYKRSHLAPSRKALELSRSGDYLSVVVPEVRGYQLVVFEE